jgi:diguanylate cyclase (GGDEF)-like protein/putative nucleotidyltransferase with HDIG domain
MQFQGRLRPELSILQPANSKAMSVRSNLKGTLLLVSVLALGVVLLLSALVFTIGLPFLTSSGLLAWLVLVVLTLAASRFTVSITTAVGVTQSRKSVADSLVFLAVLLYMVPPAQTAGPATLLAAIVALVSTQGLTGRRELLSTTAIAVISTFVSASCYGYLTSIFADESAGAVNQPLAFSLLLVPICVLAILQYFLSTVATVYFLSAIDGKPHALPSQESLVWTLTTHVGGAAAAVLFYSTIHGAGIPYALVGLLIIGLVHLLYRFNEKQLAEVRRAEAEQRKHAEEMAIIHMNTVESLAIAIDAKDQTTHGHVRRTQIYASEMGKLFKMSSNDVRALFAGALLHDIGKLAVPEYILNKPGKLTEAEFAKMKIHPTVGGDILKRVNFPYPVEHIVRYHHEKWDGSGYPKGLKGQAIPLVARIISVVDFYDATRCDRPYRKGMKREDSLALLRSMSGSAFDPRVVDIFIEHVEEFDRLIAAEDIQEQVESETLVHDYLTKTKPDAGLASDRMGTPDDDQSGFRSISDAQREVFALHEIAQTIGSSLNLNDTVNLITNKLRAIVPFDTCIVFVVDEKSGRAVAAHVAGEDSEAFSKRRMDLGDGISGWVIANARSMCNASPELDLVGVPEEVARSYRSVLVSPLLREDGAFGALTLYSKSRTSYSTEHVRLLESVCQHASSALNNALTYEKTKESALTDPLTDLPNARGFYMMLEQKLAECQRLTRESLAVLSMDVDDFKAVNERYGHAIGDRVLASLAAVMRKELRQMDFLARYAGDEFVAIMPMASLTIAGAVGERIRNAVQSQQFAVTPGKIVKLGISVGVACFPDQGETTEELLTAAARNMQINKHSRKTSLTLANSVVTTLDAFH